MTDNHSSTATSVLPFEYIDGPDFCTVIDANGDQFALTVQPDLMKRMEQALRDDIARLSRPPAQSTGDAAHWKARHDLVLQKHIECCGQPRLAEQLADVIMMLDTPDAYNREYIAAVCRSILSSFASTNLSTPPASAARNSSEVVPAQTIEPEPDAVGSVHRCPICDWPLAESQDKGCIPGDCSYRPDDPAEQERIRRRRASVSATDRGGK
jgi:hypothetical protein